MDYKFVVWGYGKRGRRFVNLCPKKHIVAIIDNNEELQGKTFEEKLIISYEQYKESYREYDIVIAVDDNKSIQNLLMEDEIFNYLLLEDVPPEIMGFGRGRWLEDLPINIDITKRYFIYGLNIYSILLRQFILSKYNYAICIVPEKLDEISKSFIGKYDFIIEGAEDILDDDMIVLYASRFSSDISEELIENVFDFSSKIAEYKMPVLQKFRNIHEGEKCFVIATGPSLLYEDLEILHKKKVFCFGVNRIYLSYTHTNWRPDCLVAIDDKIIREYSEELKRCEATIKFISDEVAAFWDESVDENVYKVHNHVLEFYPEYPNFSNDICKSIYSARTVVYACLQIAIYMGFKEIYLLGVDHNYTNRQTDVANHFHSDYYKGKIKPDAYFKDKAELAYLAAKQYADENGIKIYNATRGGKLEVFERVNFEELFE